MQKCFLGEIVIPDTLLKNAFKLLIEPPTILYVNSVQDFTTFLLATLYEKQPPCRFLESYHIGVMPHFIINNIQFSTRIGGNDSVTAIVSSIVENV